MSTFTTIAYNDLQTDGSFKDAWMDGHLSDWRSAWFDQLTVLCCERIRYQSNQRRLDDRVTGYWSSMVMKRGLRIESLSCVCP